MPRSYSNDHPGKLTVFADGDITVEIPSVDLSDASTALDMLTIGESVTITTDDGNVYAVSAAHFIAGTWEPSE